MKTGKTTIPEDETGKTTIPEDETGKTTIPVGETNKKTTSKQSHLIDPLLHLVRKNKPKRSRLRTRQRKVETAVTALTSVNDTSHEASR